MATMGNKAAVKIRMKAENPTVPLIPGYNGKDQSEATLSAEAIAMGFPVLLKAAAGGGGKGMRVVHAKEQLLDGIRLYPLYVLSSAYLLFLALLSNIDIQIERKMKYSV